MLIYRTELGIVENKTGVVQVCYFYYLQKLSEHDLSNTSVALIHT